MAGLDSAKEIEADNFVYILASKRNGILYIRVTHDLEGMASQFTLNYGVNKLVHAEVLTSPQDAINARQTSKSGRGSGNTILSRKTILIGSTYTKHLSEAKAGWPGQARSSPAMTKKEKPCQMPTSSITCERRAARARKT